MIVIDLRIKGSCLIFERSENISEKTDIFLENSK